ncbi:1-acyl-sn-glycerol-3-phosphate acyltransferase delta [Hippoglossus hippoglossus]|uniref:1-acyl-sn-glycerol-3-phosphate acyltransferase delta n=1 Tax=Hippoglossus hippoglossus TaxID=8267 RepID=UPI00148C79EE|nr:1-acyl-sn-glycerol-3-phosphate acyltransferase delta [Hippoglossus hippoglossus]XP_034464440.1 1-acyl-sn-glycerol-3-phosphate acyltransferase delta [Hippoglossus hippoglossus]
MGLLQLLKSQFVCHLLIFYVFLASGLIVNLLQICTLPLWLVSKRLARRINIQLCYWVSSQPVAVLEWWSGTQCTLYTDPESYTLYGKENAIVVMNHSFEIDFLCGWTFCERFGVLGSSKVLAKKELAYVPVIGWMWYFMEIVFCKRKWEEDRRTVAQSLQNLWDYPEKFWFLLFCEGTRLTPKKHVVSMQVAESKGLAKLKHHLLPRTKGFWVTVQNLRGTAVALYDSTLNFRNNEKPTVLGILSGKKYHADLYVRRIPLEQIPEGEAECAAWLHKLYQEKDSFQEHYTQTGRFPGPKTSPPSRPWSLINWLIWSCLLLYPLGLLLARLISSGSVFTLLAAGALCAAASLGVRWMIGQTEVDKGSSYGNKEVLLNIN